MNRHRIRRASATPDSYTACCSCGWATARRTHQLRDRDADAHQMSHTTGRQRAPASSDADDPDTETTP